MEKVFDNKLGNYIYRGDKAPWIVVDVTANDDYTMVITFVDGVKKMYNAHPLLEKKMYEPLKKISFFLTAKVVGDTMGWNDDVDITPEFWNCQYVYSHKIH